MALGNQFVPNELRDEVINRLLTIQENKVSGREQLNQMPCSNVLTAKARIPNGAHPILEFFCATNAPQSTEVWEFIFHL